MTFHDKNIFQVFQVLHDMCEPLKMSVRRIGKVCAIVSARIITE